MGREIHKGKFNGRIRYAALSTVTMDYVTPFGTRKQVSEALRKEGYSSEGIKNAFKRTTNVKVNQQKGTVAFPVYRITDNLEKWRVK